MLIAVSTRSDSLHVERFGHDFPILLLEVDDREIKSTRQLEPQSGCCRTLAQRIKEADVLLCTGVGQGAARHLKDFGVEVAVVSEGVTVTSALTSFLNQTSRVGEFTPTACEGNGKEHAGCGHDKNDDNEGEQHHCSCGNHQASDNEH